MDAAMYSLGALQKFAKMTPDEVQKVGYETALLGMGGIDVNDPGKSYSLRSLPGEFTGLHLVCLEYVAFRQVAPGLDIGSDLAREYEMARGCGREAANRLGRSGPTRASLYAVRCNCAIAIPCDNIGPGNTKPRGVRSARGHGQDMGRPDGPKFSLSSRPGQTGGGLLLPLRVGCSFQISPKVPEPTGRLIQP